MDGYPVQLEVPIAWGDLDAFGHVNNTVFFRWFESARMAYFERIGIPVERPEGKGAILATTTCDFLAEVTYPATVTVGARVSNIGNTSFVMEYGVAREGVSVGRGSGVLVFIDYQTGEKHRVPDDMRAAIASLES
jgi:acyl-CoA thioester hydrolase